MTVLNERIAKLILPHMIDAIRTRKFTDKNIRTFSRKRFLLPALKVLNVRNEKCKLEKTCTMMNWLCVDIYAGNMW